MIGNATFELYEIDRGYPELMVARVTGRRNDAWRQIQHYALMYGQDGPVSIRECAA